MAFLDHSPDSSAESYFLAQASPGSRTDDFVLKLGDARPGRPDPRRPVGPDPPSRPGPPPPQVDPLVLPQGGGEAWALRGNITDVLEAGTRGSPGPRGDLEATYGEACRSLCIP